MAIHFREAGLVDVDGLVALVGRTDETYRGWAGAGWRAADPLRERIHWSSRIAEEHGWAAVAERDGRLVGCASFRPAGSGVEVARLSRLFVDPEVWRVGIGSALLDEAIREMRSRGFGWSELYAASRNSGARAFYEHHGWQASTETRDRQGLTLVRYLLDLAIRSSA